MVGFAVGWLGGVGAGDVVDMGVAGSNYGYSLLWVLVVAVFMRFVLVSLIGRYQLCNQHGEGVLDGLVVAEVEFIDEESSRAFDPPAWFGREVTDEVAYGNANLSERDAPPPR